MSTSGPVYNTGQDGGQPVTRPMTAIQSAHFMQMRAFTIRYLKMLEDALVAAGDLRPSDRACMTREERRAASRSECNNQQGIPNYGDDR